MFCRTWHIRDLKIPNFRMYKFCGTHVELWTKYLFIKLLKLKKKKTLLKNPLKYLHII